MREPDIFIYVAVGLIGAGSIALGVLWTSLARKHNAFVEQVAQQQEDTHKMCALRYETAMIGYKVALNERRNVDESLAEMQDEIDALKDKNLAYADERLNNLAFIAKAASEEVHRLRGELGLLNDDMDILSDQITTLREDIDDKLANFKATLPAGPDAVDILNAARGLLYPYDPATGTTTAGPPTVAGPDGYPATQPWGNNVATLAAPPSDDELAAYLPDDAIDPAAEALAFFDRGMGIEGEVAGVVLEMEGEE